MMQTWQIKKGQLSSDKGVVAAQHFEAARAAADVLSRGGNAMDAAVTCALALSVVEPWLSGVGGGGFLLYGDGETGEVDTLDFNVRASRNIDPARYPLVEGNDGEWFNWPAVKEDRNIIGYESICIPGAVDGLAQALEKYGTISFAEAVQPAIELAERGMIVDWFTALCFAIDARGLAQFEHSAELFLEDGMPIRTPASGGAEYLPMPAKAKMLKRLAEAGPRDFYEGHVAKQVVEDLNAGGNVIDAEDLAGFAARWAKPATANYRDTEINVIAELSGGPSFIHAMAEVEAKLDVAKRPDAAASRLYAQAIRRAYEYRLQNMGHAARREDCTSHMSVVDSKGNMVSLTNTLLSRFGSKVTLPQTGMLMNNGMMWFDPRPGAANAIAPAAQPLANMCPVLFRKNGKPYLAIGAAGGRQIFPALVQLSSYVIDYGMSLEDAFHEPRIDASTPTILVDRMAQPDVAATIAEDFPVKIVSNTLHPVNFAIPSAVLRDADGMHHGMSHPSNPWAGVAGEGEDGSSG